MGRGAVGETPLSPSTAGINPQLVDNRFGPCEQRGQAVRPLGERRILDQARWWMDEGMSQEFRLCAGAPHHACTDEVTGDSRAKTGLAFPR